MAGPVRNYFGQSLLPLAHSTLNSIDPSSQSGRESLGFLNPELFPALNRGPLPCPTLEMEKNRSFPRMR